MTGLTATFTPGTELRCAVCEFRVGDFTNPSCLIAIDMADDGERMTPACCPEMLEGAGKFDGTDCRDFCPVCGGLQPCPTCLADLRQAS